MPATAKSGLQRIVEAAVRVSGFYDVAIGLYLMGTTRGGASDAWLVTQTVAAFLVFAGALLIWAAADLGRRAPVVLWQGMVRFWAAGATLIAFSNGWLEAAKTQAALGAAAVDVVTGVVYFGGVALLWRGGVIRALLGKPLVAGGRET